MTDNLSKLINLIQSGNFKEADTQISGQLKNSPNNFALNKLLAVSQLSQKKYANAIQFFLKCYDLNQDDYDVLLNLSFLFVKIQDYKRSIKFADAALALDPSKPGSYHNLAESYLALNKLDLALNFAIKSIECRGGFTSKEILNYPDLLNLYADILLASNKINEFKEFALSILDSGSFQGDIFKKLVRNSPECINDKHISVIKNRLVSTDQLKTMIEKNATAALSHFCLAEFFTSKKNTTEAENNFIEGNKFISNMQRTSLFKRQKTYFDLIKYSMKFDFKSIKDKIDQSKGKGLIFITGMPRSGTTLTESIISTASNTQTGGEKVFFTVNLKSITENLERINLDFKFFDELGNKYLENIDLHREGAAIFVDKLPENYLYYNFISTSLPGAKFINVYRDPWDNAISLFKEYYAEALFYASSFFGIALEIANYENMINFLKKLNGEDCMLDVQYEKLVSDPEANIKKIWDYCELSGNYSAESRKKHFANTASKQQVTKDIYKSSLKKADFLDFKDSFLIDLENQRSFWLKKMRDFNDVA